MRDIDNILLLDMLIMSRSAHRSTAGVGLDGFLRNREKRQSIVLDLLQIGHFASKISATRKAEHSEVQWGIIVGLKCRALHYYKNVNLRITWEIASAYVPNWIQQLEQILRQESVL